MSFLIDTNVLSELRKGRRGHPEFQKWSSSVDHAELFISVLVLGEIRRGIEKKAKKDPVQAATLGVWLKRVALEFSERTINVDPEIADRWGRFRYDSPLSQIDGLMAATALSRNFTFVTRNVRDVRFTDVRLLNPFTAQGASFPG